MSRGEPPTKRPRDATTQGFWLLYNQAPEMAWPNRGEGPFHEDWRNSWGAKFMYSKVYESSAFLGSGSGVPFALVGATVVQDGSTGPQLTDVCSHQGGPQRCQDLRALVGAIFIL